MLNRFGGLKWLTGEPGIPTIIRDVAEELANLKARTRDAITQGIGANFLRLIEDDPLPMTLTG